MQLTVSPDAGASGFHNVLRHLAGLAVRVESAELPEGGREGIISDFRQDDDRVIVIRLWNEAREDFYGDFVSVPITDDLHVTYL
jgi:hypothetical protein